MKKALVILVAPLIATFFVVSNANALITKDRAQNDYFGAYPNVEVVQEGQACGDVDQNAKKGGVYYECESGLSCDIFEQQGGHIYEPNGRCVKDARFACDATGGVLYDDMTCNCPPEAGGGCDSNAIRVTHRTVYDKRKDDLKITITAKNTSNKKVTWSEFRQSCGPTAQDVWGVKLKMLNTPYSHSPTRNTRGVYAVGDYDQYYEFPDGFHMYPDSRYMLCDELVKNTYSFNPREIKRSTITLAGNDLEHVGYQVQAKYGGSFEFESNPKEVYLFTCGDEQEMVDGKCGKQASRRSIIRLNSTTRPVNLHKLNDISRHWGEAYIADLFDRGIVKGYRDRTFRPNTSITRAEFVKLLIVALDYNADYSAYKPFIDITDGEWYTDYIGAAARYGFVEGYPDKTFKPNEPITRAEAVAVALRATDIKLYDYRDSFFYDVHKRWQIPYIETAYRLDLINGKGGGKFHPEDDLTRAEAAKIVSNILGLRPTNVPILKPLNTQSNQTWQK